MAERGGRDPVGLPGRPGTPRSAPRPTRRQSRRPAARSSSSSPARWPLASLLIRPDRARAFDLLHGSVFIDDQPRPGRGRPRQRPSRPSGCTATPTQRSTRTCSTELRRGAARFGARCCSTRRTGEFNMVDSTGFVVKHDGGVPLAAAQQAKTSSVGIPSGDLAYIEQTGASGTSVYLVTPATVQSAVSRRQREAARLHLDARPGEHRGRRRGHRRRLAVAAARQRQRAQRCANCPRAGDSSTGAALRSIRPRHRHAARRRSARRPAAARARLGRGRHCATASSCSPSAAAAHASGSPPPAGVDKILPDRAIRTRRLSFLMHGSDGWSVVSVNPTAPACAGRRRYRAAGHAPHWSSRRRTTARSTRWTASSVRSTAIDAAGATTKVADYPLAEQDGSVIEPAKYAGVYVIARESRVIVDASQPARRAGDIHRRQQTTKDDREGRRRCGQRRRRRGSSRRGTHRHSEAEAERQHAAPTAAKLDAPAADATEHQQAPLREARTQAAHPAERRRPRGSRSALVSWTYPTPRPRGLHGAHLRRRREAPEHRRSAAGRAGHGRGRYVGQTSPSSSRRRGTS